MRSRQKLSYNEGVNRKSAQERIRHLREVINHHRYLYHVLDLQEISDEALDSLKKELFDLEGQFPDLVTPDSPTQRVGGEPLKEFKKVVHATRMNSLNDAFSKEDMVAWISRLTNFLGGERAAEFYCDLKMDGLAVELVYRGGILMQGSTRGDGLVGEDITQNIKTIEAIPLVLESKKERPEELIVRGEVFLTKKEFDLINREQKKRGEKIYANPRNVAAGSLRQLNPKITASRKLNFYAYAVAGSGKEHVRMYPTRESEYAALNALGIRTNPEGKVVHSLDEVFKFQEKWVKQREKLAYEIDGIVVSINDNRMYVAAGIIGKAPRAGVAYKFSPREATTVVEDITVQVGRTGALTPVAVMRPVGVGGVMITHASLHNADEIERLELKIGDTVIVSRAGDVIPQVTKVLKELRTGAEKEFTMPKRCPVCGHSTIRQALSEEARKGAATVCPNRRCPAKNLRAIAHAVNAFEIYTIGPKIIARFKDEGLISDASDILKLKKEDIESLDRFGEKSAENIVRSIQNHKRISLSKFIYALGIPHVGEETAIDLATHFGSLEKIMRASIEEIDTIPNIGGAVARSISEYFADSHNREYVERLLSAGAEIIHEKPKKTSGPLQGKKVVVTGTLESLSREEAKEAVRAAGGDWVVSVSKNTDYVVVGAEPGSKFEKAKKLGVKILDEKDFLELLK